MSSALHVGALEGRRWAGLILADPHGGAGLGVRLRFTTPQGQSWDWEDWYWAVSSVGPHAADGSFATVAFDLSQPPSPENEPRETDLLLSWSRNGPQVHLRAEARVAGTLEVVGDSPWDWSERWTRVDETRWQGRIGDTIVSLAFGGGTAADPSDGPELVQEVARAGEVGDGPQITLGMAWRCGAASPSHEGDPGGARPPDARTLLPGVDRRLSQARTACADERPSATGEWSDLLDRISDHLHWMVLIQPETGSLYTPAGRRWIFPRLAEVEGSSPGHTPLDHWTAFGWDSFFNALELSITSPLLAWDTLLAGLRTQYENGNVPNWRGRFGGTPDRSQPPVGAYAALRLHLSHPAESRLDDAFPYLLRWSDWWDGVHQGRRRRQGLSEGLYSWGSDTSLIPDRVPPWEAGAPGHQRAAWESGQDDLPLWDEADWDEARESLAMSAVDLSSYRALDLECLSRIARIVGHSDEADQAEEHRARLAARINERLWSDERGLYLDELPSGHSKRVGASNFLPLVAGIPDEARARRMLSTLTEPVRFWGPWILPSISRDDPAFPDQQYWRGSIWPPMNYLVLQGLRRYGFYEQARTLALRGARMFLEDARATGMCRENFDARTGQGHGRRFQSWGPLFALGAVEELVHASPWSGITLGFGGAAPAATEPGADTGVRRLRLAGHTWSVEPKSQGYQVQVDGSEWIDVVSSEPLTHVYVQDGVLHASGSPGTVASAESEIRRVDDAGRVRMPLVQRS